MAWLLTIALQPGTDPEELERQLWDLGTTGLAEVNHHGTSSLIAGFDQRADADRAADAIGPMAMVTPVDATSWPTPGPQELMVGGCLLTIEVAQAFGHGHHPTTRLALEAVTRLATPDTDMLDIGTGTGILALAASALGAVPVIGIDIDPAAVAVARRNVIANGLEVEILDRPLDQIAQQFGLAVVNMLAAELAPLADEVTRHLQPGGSLIVTGFLAEQRDWVRSMFAPLVVTEYDEGDDGWARTIFTRSSTSE